MKETIYKGNLFINGRRAAVVGYDNGECYILYFSKSLGEGIGVDKLREAGVSLHQFNNALPIPSADEAGVKSVIPDAVIDLPGTEAHAARVAAATGSRGGEKKETTTAETETKEETPTTTTTTAVAAPGAFNCPAAKDIPALAAIIQIMPAIEAPLNEYGAKYAEFQLNATDVTPELPESVKTASALIPSLDAAVFNYKDTIMAAAAEYKAKQAAEQAAKEAAAAAAASGKNLVTLSDGSTVEVTGKTHPAFREVLEDLKDLHAVYLYGPAGTGKSYMAQQLAEALGVEFYSSSQAQLKYDLLGTYNANGEHIYTSFTRAAINGGVWLWDEFDRSSQDSTTAINDALANGKVDIPGIGMVEIHPDFYAIASGNTCGFGGSSKYVAAQQQDFSSLTRFLSKIYIGYCREMDMIITNNNEALCDFAEAVRDAIKQTGIDIDLPIRALKPLQRKANRDGYRRALECCLFAGIGATQVKQIATRVNGSGVWFNALKEYAEAI